MKISTEHSLNSATKLDVKAEFLTVLLRAGLEDDFGRKFKTETRDFSAHQTEALVSLINSKLACGVRRRDLRVVMSQNDDVTVLDRSRFFGNAFSVARQTFAT
jgi:hypothetical protein